MQGKRTDYLDWDSTFMGIAVLISLRSKDPSTRHGSVIVNQSNQVVSLGYNGLARGCNDDIFPWTSPEKYDYVAHSESNAIDNSGSSDLTNCKLYLWSEKGYLPCSQCAIRIIQRGIKEVIIASKISENTKEYNWEPTKKMFETVGIKIRVLENSATMLIKSSDELIEAAVKIDKIKGHIII